MEENSTGGSTVSSKSFGDFMKGYNERKASGADGISLLSGAQDSRNSGNGFIGTFAGYFNGDIQEEPSVLLRRTAGSLKSGIFQMGNSISSSLGNGDIFDTSSQNQEGDIEAGGDANANSPAASASSGFSDAFGSLSRSQRFKGFVAMLCLSGFFFLLSSFFFPVVLVVPAKFAFSFSLGSVCFMMAFALMQGPTNWIKAVCSKDRLPFTLSYYGSLFFTFYSAIVWRRYLAIVFFSWVQIGCLIWYGATYLPGGRMGIRIIYNFIVQFATRFMYPCIKTSISCFSRLFN